MKWCAVTKEDEDKRTLAREYKEARAIGVTRLGSRYLYFRKMRTVYYIPYEDIKRVFRRVMLVPAGLCCGKGSLAMETLVICTEKGEQAQIQMPGARAAKGLMEELRQKAPDALFVRPEETKDT